MLRFLPTIKYIIGLFFFLAVLKLGFSYFFCQVPLQCRNVSTGSRVVSIRAQVTTEAPAKVVKESKKNEEGVVVNKYKPKTPYIGRCLLNTKITGDDAPGETWHMVFTTEGMFFLHFLSKVLIFSLISECI